MAASQSVAITYVPADCGSIIPGKSKAPQAFRDAGIVTRLADRGVSTVTEHEALSAPATHSVAKMGPRGVRNEELNIEVCKQVHSTISDNLRGAPHEAGGPLPFQLILGGECCMSPAIMSAFWQHQQDGKRVGLMYIDADLDLASPTDPGSTGVFAGMNCANLLGFPGTLESMKQFSRAHGGGFNPVCDSSNLVFFGTNMTAGACPGNKTEHFAHLFDNNFKVVSAASVERDPAGRAEEALRFLQDQVDVILVHLDVDSIDPVSFPLANVPNYTGVQFESMMQALSVFMASSKVAALTIAEVNPDHDPSGSMVRTWTDRVTAMLAARGHTS
ncbi:uncharacterized protein B0I36DRAFT_360069 [Microdochium trichocladiopsis]|uniref:Arginase/deacetylase n=1 Tax=Microdochium trichocladiopsis TaxID=1682393 RepID=A0A9P8YAU5_9PEZI|nr:uncharacterized protein B0I36DRAFT_360069 [Microdochium trichocladiopsis]KAH7034555.1 hypothetical protein B0I36DRAFT_360069 [Microdochium trichocladiopsis]